MRTDENRNAYDHSKRGQSDLTDADWALIGKLIAPPRRGGNKRTVYARAVVNGCSTV